MLNKNRKVIWSFHHDWFSRQCNCLHQTYPFTLSDFVLIIILVIITYYKNDCGERSWLQIRQRPCNRYLHQFFINDTNKSVYSNITQGFNTVNRKPVVTKRNRSTHIPSLQTFSPRIPLNNTVPSPLRFLEVSPEVPSELACRQGKSLFYIYIYILCIY
jgi:hypothetical protein